MPAIVFGGVLGGSNRDSIGAQRNEMGSTTAAQAHSSLIGELSAEHLGFDANGLPRSDITQLAAVFGGIGAR